MIRELLIEELSGEEIERKPKRENRGRKEERNRKDKRKCRSIEGGEDNKYKRRESLCKERNRNKDWGKAKKE